MKISIAEDQILKISVRGSSMEPMIKHGSILNWRKRNKKNLLRLGHVYLIRTSKGLILKRLFAKSGDSFHVIWKKKFCELKINKLKIQNSKQITYRFPIPSCHLMELYEKDGAGRIPQGMALVLGDNISNSTDSSEFGLIRESDLVGEVIPPSFADLSTYLGPESNTSDTLRP